MKKFESVKENYEFRRVYKRGKSNVDAYLAVYFLKNYQKKSRIGISVGTKVAGAVGRNKIKRRIRSAYIEQFSSIKKGYDIIVVARTRAAFADYMKLNNSLVYHLKKLNMWEQNDEKSH